MQSLPTVNERPDGLHQRYHVESGPIGLRYMEISPEAAEQLQRIVSEPSKLTDWTQAELGAIGQLAAEQELTPHQVLRQALRLYQLHHARVKDGDDRRQAKPTTVAQ